MTVFGCGVSPFDIGQMISIFSLLNWAGRAENSKRPANPLSIPWNGVDRINLLVLMVLVKVIGVEGSGVLCLLLTGKRRS